MNYGYIFSRFDGLPFSRSGAPTRIMGKFGPPIWCRPDAAFQGRGREEDAKTLAWESNLETARRILKPDAPSRLGCIFGCASLVHALAFRDKYRAGAPIFEVAAADDVANYVGDFDLISSQPTGIALVDALVVGCNQILERAAIRHSGSSYRRPGHNRKEALRSGVITALAT